SVLHGGNLDVLLTASRPGAMRAVTRLVKGGSKPLCGWGCLPGCRGSRARTTGRRCRRAPRTVEEDRRLWRLHLLPRFGSLRLPQVTPELVLRMKHNLADRPVAANRALQQLVAAFSFAKKLRWTTENPADERTVDRYTEAPESRSLQPEEY